MKTVGLITEYNPFHNGHLYHLEQAKKITGADYAIVIMSGNFVQRGAPAILPKEHRAKSALLAGADMVLELPVYYAAGSAEYFAEGAVSILDALGITDFLVFGSEIADTGLLTSLAGILLKEPEEYRILLKNYLKQGLAFPSARAKSLYEYLLKYPLNGRYSSEDVQKALQSPNCILGIEYIKALLKRNSQIKPMAITRVTAAYHDEALQEKISSATAIRTFAGKEDNLKKLAGQVPASCLEILQEQHGKSFPVSENDFSLLLQYKLLLCSGSYWQYADVSVTLSNRIENLLPSFVSYSGFCELLKTKELTYTRISRALLHILLDIKKDQMKLQPGYVRLIGFRQEASELFGLLKTKNTLPLITKYADAKKQLSGSTMECFLSDIKTSHIYQTVVSHKFHQPFVSEFARPMIIS